MREYELMHVTTSNLVDPPLEHNEQLRGTDEELVDFDSFAHRLPTASSTVIIREKQSFLHRLSHNFTITRLLALGYSGIGLGSRGRQGPDMKLKQRWILLGFILICTLVILLFSSLTFGNFKLATHQLGITLNLEELTDRDKCPACFGVNLCPAIFNGEIELNDWNKFAMSRVVNVKNVYYATWKDENGAERQIVLKKLAHNSELEKLDKSICDRHHGAGHGHCDVSETVVDLIEKYKLEKLSYGPGPTGNAISLNGVSIGEGSDLLLCPSHRKTDFVVEAGRKSLRGQHHDTILANILTMILLNPEPLLLQSFPQSGGWPFPAYYGACGRLIAQEYVGRRLTTYVTEPFHVRASLAKQLLEMAMKFTNNPTNFILYLTDPTPDNFAVDEKTGIVRAIDLENLMVVDKEELWRSATQGSDKLLESESSSCGRDGNAENLYLCFSFSSEDLCGRQRTDHNQYAVCAGLLAEGALATEFPDGLLHSLPPEFTLNPKLTAFQDVLLKCKDPKLGDANIHYDRLQAADELIHQLDLYLKTKQMTQEKEP